MGSTNETSNQQYLSRHELIKATKRDNPDIPYMSPLFREAFLLNAANQEGLNVKRLADFTGMSKGEVVRHLAAIVGKLKEIEEDESETDQTTTTERQGIHDGVAQVQREVQGYSDVPPIGT